MRSSRPPTLRLYAALCAFFGLLAAPAWARGDVAPAESPFSTGLEAGLAYVGLLTRAPEGENEDNPAGRTGVGAFAAASVAYEATRRLAFELFLPTSFPDLAPGDPGFGLDFALGATPHRLLHAFASFALPTSAESSAEHRLTAVSVGGASTFPRSAWTFSTSANATLDVYRRDAPGHDRERWRYTGGGDASRYAGDLQLGAGAGVSLVQLERGAPFVEVEVTLVEVRLALRPRPRPQRRPKGT
jgi:hypothetical protein